MAPRKTGPGEGRALRRAGSFLISNFDVEGSALKEFHKTFLLRHVVEPLKNGAGAVLFGMTDSTGSDTYNNALSDKRVASTLAFLREKSPNDFAARISDLRGEHAARQRVGDDKDDPDFRGVIVRLEAKPKIETRTTIDFIIRLAGHTKDEDLPPEKVLGDQTLARAKVYRALKNRWLHRIGRNTSRSGAEALGMRKALIATVKRIKGQDPLGVVIIYGASSGARNAISLMQEMDAEGIPTTFLGLSDAAFFPQDARPRFLPNRGPFLVGPLPIPSFNAGAITAKETQNYYQVKGNDTDFIFAMNKLQYGSSMLFKEIHGKVDGMINIDLSMLCTETDHFKLHQQVNNLSMDPLREAVLSVLDRAEILSPREG